MFNSMDSHSYILWIFLAFLCAISLLWHCKENTRLSKTWKESLDNETASALIRFAWGRSLQLFIALVLLVPVILTYDWQLSQSKADIQTLNDIVTEEKTTITRMNEKQAAELNLKATTPMPAEDTVDGIYNPEVYSTGNASAIDSVKKRYEEILVTYFFLIKCGAANPLDYHIITSALSQEMASINAPGRLQNDIVTAAKGSYKEMYSQTRCEGAGMEALQKQYSDYIDNLSKNFVSH